MSTAEVRLPNERDVTATARDEVVATTRADETTLAPICMTAFRAAAASPALSKSAMRTESLMCRNVWLARTFCNRVARGRAGAMDIGASATS
jgi:hypothetical protein